MASIKNLPVISCTFLLIAVTSLEPAKAQKYKTLEDTVRLNKEYGEVSLDMAKLNTKLIEAKNKSADYQSKTSSTASDAISSGQASKDQASAATSGNTTDTKKAVRDAKRADREANNAKDAVADQQKNDKTISRLSSKINEKQQKLNELDATRAAIIGKSTPPIKKSQDSINLRLAVDSVTSKR